MDLTVADIEASIRKEARGSLPADLAVSEDSTLEDLGLSSLQVSEVIFGIEDDLDIELDEAEAAEVKTIGDLLRLIRGTVSA